MANTTSLFLPLSLCVLLHCTCENIHLSCGPLSQTTLGVCQEAGQLWKIATFAGLAWPAEERMTNLPQQLQDIDLHRRPAATEANETLALASLQSPESRGAVSHTGATVQPWKRTQQKRKCQPSLPNHLPLVKENRRKDLDKIGMECLR